MRTVFLASVVLAQASACAATDFGAAYSRAIDLCEEYKLPNSMARPPGFDLDKRLSEVQAERQELATEFATPDGLTYLEERAAKGGEELQIVCTKELLSAARSMGR